jgi:hypothetical protein
MYFCVEEGAPCTTLQMSTWEIKTYRVHEGSLVEFGMNLACFVTTDDAA